MIDPPENGEEQPRREFTIQLERAQNLSNVGNDLPAGTRLRMLKQLIRRLARVITTEQVEFNHQVLLTLSLLDDDLGRLQSVLDHRTVAAEAATTSVELLLQKMLESFERYEASLADIRTQITSARTSVNRPAIAETDGNGHPQVEFERFSQLYAQFEARFRGSTDEVKSRLKDYLPDARSTRSLPGVILDIGFGRGEWLELLTEEEIPAYGIDLNVEFVRSGQQKGLDVRHEDAVDHLKGVQPGALKVITAFHLIEHLSNDTLLHLLELALRALQPGGLLILETPNPTNVFVGAATFYLDPTHNRPLHPLLTQFLCEAVGFHDVDIRYFQRDTTPDIRSMLETDSPQILRTVAGLLDQAFLAGQDYGIVARKPAPPEVESEPQ